MMSIKNIQHFENEIGHRTFSFDGGKLSIKTTNNGKNWDCVVKVIDSEGKVAATTRTYTSLQEIEVNPGIYKVSIQALAMEGIETYSEFENIDIRANEVATVSHNFMSGYFEIFTKVGDKNIDTIVTIKELKSGQRVGGSRTYNKGYKFLLNPGNYKVTAQPLGKYKDKESQTINIEVKSNELNTKELKF